MVTKNPGLLRRTFRRKKREGCTALLDRNNFFTNTFKLPLSNNTFQNDFGCPARHPRLMLAEYIDEGSGVRGVAYICCVAPVSASSGWNVQQPKEGKVCTMRYDKNNWFSNGILRTKIDDTVANRFSCPDGFPLLMTSRYLEIKDCGGGQCCLFR